MVGFIYGKYGKPPRSPQDPGVYAAFLHGGTTREKRGRTPETNFADVATSPDAVNEAIKAFADKFRQRLHLLKGK